MAAPFGLSATGFLAMRQQDINAAIFASLQQTFGQNINLGASSVFSSLINPFSAQLALVWELGEGIYNSQYPNGAEGTSVDNILALNNLKRLGATATITAPEALIGNDQITRFGLVLLGTPGTQIPAGSLIETQANPPLVFTLDSSVTISPSSNAVQSLIFNNVPTIGAFQVSLTDNNENVLDSNANVIEYSGNTLTTAPINWNALVNQTFFSLGSPSSGTFKLNLSQSGVVQQTGSLNFNATALQIQNAIQLLTGYGSVTVTGGPVFTITWGSISNPLVTITSLLVGATLSEVDSVQASFNNLHDAISLINHYPYSDLIVSGSFAVGFTFSFGLGTPTTGNLTSGAQPISLMAIASNTLFNGTTFTTVNLSTTTTGSQAQGVGSATCTVTGINNALAGTINTINSPVSGWTGVTNQLDAIDGTNAENDTQALIRRLTLLSAQGNGPLQAIVAKVTNTPSTPPITAVLGFENLSSAAIQILGFSTVPTPGNTISLKIGPLVTGLITINNTSADATSIQSAIQALAGYSSALVIGNTAAGFSIDFDGSNGGQPQPLIIINTNSTGSVITPRFGRPGKSVEIVVQGGGIADITNSIFASKPGGIETYGTPFDVNGDTALSSNIINNVSNALNNIVVGMFVSGPGIIPDTTVVSVATNSVVISNPATATAAAVPLSFTYSALVKDIYGNEHQINFSRPSEIPFYVTLSLITDAYNIPGNLLSGINPQALFVPSSISTIVSDLVSIGNAVPIGGRVVGFGTGGLVGSFNNVPGIVGYTLLFGTSPSPVSNNFIQLLPEQLAVFESINVTVSYA